MVRWLIRVALTCNGRRRAAGSFSRRAAGWRPSAGARSPDLVKAWRPSAIRRWSSAQTIAAVAAERTAMLARVMSLLSQGTFQQPSLRG